MRRQALTAAGIAIAVLALAPLVTTRARAEVGLVDHQGQTLAIGDLAFHDEAGRSLTIGSLFSAGRPVLLTLVYYSCPGVCALTLDALFDGLKRARFAPGRAVETVVVSIDPRDTASAALARKAELLARHGFGAQAPGFHFLTGETASIQTLADRLGFRFERAGDGFSHPGVVYVLSPAMRMTKSLPNARVTTRELRELVAAAATGRTTSAFERMVLACGTWWQRGWTGRLLAKLGF